MPLPTLLTICAVTALFGVFVAALLWSVWYTRPVTSRR